MDTHFQAFLRLTYSTYAENPNSLQLFSKNFSHQVYCQKFRKRSRFSELFSKNLSLPSFGRPDITISPIFYAPIRQNYPLPGLFPKRHPVVLLLSEKIPQKTSSPTTDCRNSPPVLLHPFSTFFQKFLSLHCCISLFSHKRITPPSGIFSKKVLLATPVTIAFFLRFVSGILKKLKNLPERE